MPVAIASVMGAAAAVRVDQTFLDAGFWTDQLRAVDAYERVYSEVLPAAAADFSEPAPGGAEFDFTRFNADIVRVAREVVPPEWVEAQVESALLTLLPYLTGETDSLSVTIPFRDRTEAAAAALKRETKDPAVYLPLYSEGVSWGAHRVAEATADSEIPIAMTEDEAAGFIRRVVPPEWLRASLEEAVDEALPYLVNEADGFETTIELKERVDSLAEVVGEVVGKAGSDDLIIDDVVMPAAARNLESQTDAIDGAGLTPEQILGAVREELTPEWAAEIRGQLIGSVADYLTGRSDILEVTIELGDRRGRIVEALAPSVEAALASEYALLPVCTAGNRAGAAVVEQRLPACRLPGLTYDGFLSNAGSNPAAEIAAALGPLVPDEFVFDEAHLREAAGPMTSETLDIVRRWSLEGFVISHESILENLDPEDRRSWNDLRTAGAFTLNETDFDQDLSGTRGDTDSVWGGVRTTLGIARQAWIEAVLLVLVIGGLGGRNWGSRLGWACVPLLLGAAALWVLAAPVYDAFGPGFWAGTRDDGLAGAGSALDRVMIELSLDFGQSVVGAFAGGLARTGLALLVLGGLGLTFAIFLQSRSGQRRRRPVNQRRPGPFA